MLKCFLFLLLASSGGCILGNNVADKKFFTAVHDDRDSFKGLLIRKVHYPTWRIYYAFDNCDNETITAEQKQYHQKIIADYLKIWIKPLRQLTTDKLIGDEPNDIEFIPHTGNLSAYNLSREYKRINEGDDEHVLTIIISCQAGGYRGIGMYGGVGILGLPLINSAAKTGWLLTSLGNSFGLLGTRDNFITNGMDAASVMGQIYTYDKNGTPLLADDDIKGIQWMYRFFHKERLASHAAPTSVRDCVYAGYIYVGNEWEEGACRPRDLFMHLLRQAHAYEKNHHNLQAAFLTLEKSVAKTWGRNARDYNVDAYDDRGNTGLHYAVLFGAWSLWSEHNGTNTLPCHTCEGLSIDSSAYNITNTWQHSLAKVLEARFKPCTGKKDDNSACVEVNKENNRGNTALHYAASTGYTKAVELLLTRQEINLFAKNSDNETPCSLAQKTLVDLQQIGLTSIKVKPTKIEQILQAIRAARTEIVRLLTDKSACETQSLDNSLSL